MGAVSIAEVLRQGGWHYGEGCLVVRSFGSRKSIHGSWWSYAVARYMGAVASADLRTHVAMDLSLYVLQRDWEEEEDRIWVA